MKTLTAAFVLTLASVAAGQGYTPPDYLCDTDYVARAVVAWAEYMSGAIDAAGYVKSVGGGS